MPSQTFSIKTNTRIFKPLMQKTGKHFPALTNPSTASGIGLCQLVHLGAINVLGLVIALGASRALR